MLNLKNTRLLGHRGARSEALENTLFGFEHTQSLQRRGLAGVEFDVQLTADGHLAIFHDDTLQRLCGLQSRIDQLSLIEIRRHLQFGHNIFTLDMLIQALESLSLQSSSQLSSQTVLQTIDKPSSKAAASNPLTPQKLALNRLLGAADSAPSNVTTTLSSNNTENNSTSKLNAQQLLTVAQVFTQFTHIELEIKTHSRTNYSKLIRALSDYLIDTPLAQLPIVLTSFDRQLLAQLQRSKILSHILRGLLIRDSQLLATAPNTALQLGCSHLGIYYPLLTQAAIKYFHRYGLPVSAWTVNDIEFAKQLVQWQVDVIITDIPTQLL